MPHTLSMIISLLHSQIIHELKRLLNSNALLNSQLRDGALMHLGEFTDGHRASIYINWPCISHIVDAGANVDGAGVGLRLIHFVHVRTDVDYGS